MKNNIKLLTLASILTLGVGLLSGCKRGDSFFISPNSPVEVTPGLTLTAIQVSTFNSYEGGLVKDASILIQQNAGVDGQSLPINNYILGENEFDNQWAQLYQALYSCKDLQTKYGAANPYFSGITDVLAAMNWGMLTDLWGDIPFSDALQGKGNNYQSKYDPQEKVITGIIALLDDGIAKLGQPADANELLPGSADLVFGGDPASWIKAANTLKARYLNRLSNKPSYNPAAILTALSNGITSTDEDFISVHGDGPGESNQWFDFQGNREFYIVAALPFVDSMSLRPTDLRLNAYFTAYDSTGVRVGSPIDVTTSNASEWGDYLAASSATNVHLVSFMEAKFIEAEVKARQGAADASTALNDAIKASCTLATAGAYDGSDIATYTSANTTVDRVIYEKWIALFGSVEPYNDYRRTGFPKLTPNASGRLPVIPKRYPTPQGERVANPNAPTVSLTTPVWFAQ